MGKRDFKREPEAKTVIIAQTKEKRKRMKANSRSETLEQKNEYKLKSTRQNKIFRERNKKTKFKN